MKEYLYILLCLLVTGIVPCVLFMCIFAGLYFISEIKELWYEINKKK